MRQTIFDLAGRLHVWLDGLNRWDDGYYGYGNDLTVAIRRCVAYFARLGMEVTSSILDNDGKEYIRRKRRAKRQSSANNLDYEFTPFALPDTIPTELQRDTTPDTRDEGIVSPAQPLPHLIRKPMADKPSGQSKPASETPLPPVAGTPLKSSGSTPEPVGLGKPSPTPKPATSRVAGTAASAPVPPVVQPAVGRTAEPTSPPHGQQGRGIVVSLKRRPDPSPPKPHISLSPEIDRALHPQPAD